MSFKLCPIGKPLVPVVVGVSSAYAKSFHNKLEFPPTKKCLGLVDTGASISVINNTIVERFSLTQRGYCEVASFHFEGEV